MHWLWGQSKTHNVIDFMCMHAVIAPNSTHQVFCLAFPPEDVDDDSLLDSSELSDSDSEDEVTFFLPFFAFFPRAFFDLRFFRFLRRLQLLDSESDPRSLEASTALKMVSRALSSVFSMPSLSQQRYKVAASTGSTPAQPRIHMWWIESINLGPFSTCGRVKIVST